MLKHKKILSLILALSMTATLSLSAFADFSDLEGHWAQSYMEDLYDRGYLSGYSDGTMQPENNITSLEALVFLSRFHSPSDTELSYILSDYESILDEYIPSGYTWATDSVAICLAAEIISEDELEDMDITASVTKEFFSVMLVRALCLEDETASLGISSLTFTDKLSIQSKYCGYVALLQTIGVVTGDENNEFSPATSVTRAMAATFVSRSLDYIDNNDIDLTIANYSGLVRSIGIMYSLSSSTAVIRSLEGLLMEFDVTGDTSIITDDDLGTSNSDYNGYYVSYAYNDNELIVMSFDRDEDETWLLGKVSSFYSSVSRPYFYLSDAGDSTRFYYDSDESVLYIDGEVSDFDELSTWLTVSVLVDDDSEIIEMYTFTDDVTFNGIVCDVIYGSTITIKTLSDDGLIYVMYLSASDLPDITRNDDDITIDRITVGTEITVTLDGTEVDEIESEATVLSMAGTLVSSTTSSAGTYWIIEDEDGEESTYLLDTYVSVYYDDTAISISDVSIGDSLEFNLYGDVISDVEVVDIVLQSSTIVATVIATDVSDKMMTVLLGGKMLYVDSNCTIMNSETGKSVALSTVDINDVVTIYGSYDSSSEFTATMIIIE